MRQNRPELAGMTLFARTKRMHMDCNADAQQLVTA